MAFRHPPFDRDLVGTGSSGVHGFRVVGERVDRMVPPVPGHRRPGSSRAGTVANMASEQPVGRSERETLCEFLDYQRQGLIGRLDGLTDQQVRMTPTVSSLSLLSLVKHSAVWERRWFQVIVAGRRVAGEWPEVPDEPSEAVEDPTFELAAGDTVASVVAEYRDEIAAANEILAEADLDGPCASDKIDENVRWVAIHMIEETARHAGHADIIRETIDGTRGR